MNTPFASPESGPCIIAEAGVNHNGDLDRAKRMVAAAAQAGADFVKFQAFRAEGLTAIGTPAAAYQQANAGIADQTVLLRGLELSLDAFAEIATTCRDEGIGFLCTPFDAAMTADLVRLGMSAIKVASGELTNSPALRHFASFGLPILLSTGMATLEEVRRATSVIAEAGGRDVTLLHCTSLYPAPSDSLNLRAIATLREALGYPVGYSDHSLGDHAAIAAVALGASVIEKHFTLDRRLPGPDHRASLEPDELAAMVVRLREVHAALGDGIKQPVPDELEIARLVRRSWHTTRALPAGARLGTADLVLKRPANGLPPDKDPSGQVLRTALDADKPVCPGDLVL